MGDFIRIFILCLIVTPILLRIPELFTIFEDGSVRNGIILLVIAAGLFILLAKMLAIIAAKRSENQTSLEDDIPPS